MIIEVSSSLPSFKRLQFKQGLNILLSERHGESAATDVRSGAGKTMFVELVHYLLSENRSSRDGFHKPELLDVEYEVVFKGDDGNFAISKIAGGKTDLTRLSGVEVKAADLRADLSLKWFQISAGISLRNPMIKFKSLFDYFARRESMGGFASPVSHSQRQKASDSQISLAYLLGFDWELMQNLQTAKNEKKSADALSKAAKTGYLANGDFDESKMQTRLDFLENLISEKRAEADSMIVLDGYQKHEQEANALTTRIRDMNEENLMDLDLIQNIEGAISENVNISTELELEGLYKEVGIYFGEQIKHRFDQAKNFHKQVAHNRKEHLKREKENAENRLGRRKEKILIFQSKLSDKLALLKSGVTFERMTLLQSELKKLEAEQAQLKHQLPQLQQLEANRKLLRQKINNLLRLVQSDVMEREATRRFAVETFANLSKSLYGQPGELTIRRSSGTAGLSIETNIPGKKSSGKTRMQVFCFDWLLVEAAVKQNKFPGFLIHDSHVFDGVDGRQIARALRLAKEKCEELGVQYIVAMNSDDLKKIQTEANAKEMGFDPYEHIIEPRLTDQPDGGLFGIRF